MKYILVIIGTIVLFSFPGCQKDSPKSLASKKDPQEGVRVDPANPEVRFVKSDPFNPEEGKTIKIQLGNLPVEQNTNDLKDELVKEKPAKEEPLKVVMDPDGPTLTDPNYSATPQLRSILLSRGETIGKIAGWSGVSTHDIITWNSLKPNSVLQIGQELTLVLNSDQWDELQRKRNAFKNAFEQSYFKKWRVSSLNLYTVKKGDSLYSISKNNGGIPLWVIEKYNPGKDFNKLFIGESLFIPVIVQNGSPSIEQKEPTIAQLKKISDENDNLKKAPAVKKVISPEIPYEGLVIQLKPYESLDHISYWSGLTVEKILTVNQLKSASELKAGMKIRLPIDDQGVNRFYTLRKKYHETIGQLHDAPINENQKEKNKPTINAQKLQDNGKGKKDTKLAVRKVINHKIASGDSAWKIAQTYKVPLKVLEEYNSDRNLEMLQIGDIIKVPLLSQK